MGVTSSQTDVVGLQRRVEHAIRACRPREQIVGLLEELVAVADEHSEAAHFAHRQLAEMLLEENPWGAALHLRRLLTLAPDDAASHALMGLCQSLQRNYRAAVSSFRRALALSPSNPWFNHNLGHLLDVALDAPHDALSYLRKAHRAAPEEVEVGASYAHCLGRTGAVAEGTEVVRSLLRRAPYHDDLRQLQRWLEQGAPPRRAQRNAPLLHSTHPSAPSAVPHDPLLESFLRRAGSTDDEIARAQRIWDDFSQGERSRMCPVTAAAIDYALARIDGATARQREVADRHAVRPHELARRFREIRERIHLGARDPRYA